MTAHLPQIIRQGFRQRSRTESLILAAASAIFVAGIWITVLSTLGKIALENVLGAYSFLVFCTTIGVATWAFVTMRLALNSPRSTT